VGGDRVQQNRDRLLAGEIAEKFFAQVLEQARTNDLLSDEHFSVDGTLIEAWASQKSFQRKDQDNTPPPEDPGNPTVDFHGEERRNDTHQSTTDPEARLARKSSGHESKLAYCGNVLIENRNGLVVDTELVMASGTAERDAAVEMAARIEGDQQVTVGADKGYDTRGFVRDMRERNVTPHGSGAVQVYDNTPAITSVSPSAVAPAQSNVPLIISGTNFGSQPGSIAFCLHVDPPTTAPCTTTSDITLASPPSSAQWIDTPEGSQVTVMVNTVANPEQGPVYDVTRVMHSYGRPREAGNTTNHLVTPNIG
jgi:hypothetical protein